MKLALQIIGCVLAGIIIVVGDTLTIIQAVKQKNDNSLLLFLRLSIFSTIGIFIIFCFLAIAQLF